MSRIDEALRRAGTEETSVSPVTLPSAAVSGTDVFESPWAFNQNEPATEVGAQPGLTPPVLDGTISKDGRLGLLQGFPSELASRIVASPTASPVLTEQFRRLAAALHHSQLVQGTKVVMVTSANPADGKSLTAANLALTLSQSYRRQVLLVDADLRRPSMHEIFRVPNVAGLNDGLKAKHDAKLSVLQISETLTLLPAGRPDPDPMSSLTSARMSEILKEGASRFDWVIVDTAPIGLLADANLLSTIVDGALLVIRAGQTPFAAVTRAVENLGRDRILGVVLNASDTGGAHQEYYGHYSPTPPAAPGEGTTALAKSF